jgi:transposase
MNTQGRYDVSGTQWSKIAPILPPEHSGKRGRPYVDHRRVINGILWVMHTGAPWADMPERYGSPKTCFDRFTRWQRDGTWARILQTLAGAEAADSPASFSDIYIDSTTTKVHPHAAGARHRRAKPLKRGAGSMSPSVRKANALVAAGVV